MATTGTRARDLDRGDGSRGPRWPIVVLALLLLLVLLLVVAFTAGWVVPEGDVEPTG